MPAPATVVAGFAVLNVVCVVTAAVVWLLIAGEMRLGRPARLLGFAALFGNYVVLKWSVYSPVMTDIDRMKAWKRCEMNYIFGPAGHAEPLPAGPIVP